MRERHALDRNADCTGGEMKLSEIEHIQVIVRINGKYYLVLMNAATDASSAFLNPLAGNVRSIAIARTCGHVSGQLCAGQARVCCIIIR